MNNEHTVFPVSHFWLRQELKKSQSAFVRLSGPNLSESLNLHLLTSGLKMSTQSQRALREQSESNQTASYRRSLKYFVLLNDTWIIMLWRKNGYSEDRCHKIAWGVMNLPPLVSLYSWLRLKYLRRCNLPVPHDSMSPHVPRSPSLLRWKHLCGDMVT